MKCNECGKEFYPGNRIDGLPNGVGFQLEDGTIYNVCCECVMKIGRKKMKGGKNERANKS